jgi:hypothetical protein
MHNPNPDNVRNSIGDGLVWCLVVGCILWAGIIWGAVKILEWAIK